MSSPYPLYDVGIVTPFNRRANWGVGSVYNLTKVLQVESGFELNLSAFRSCAFVFQVWKAQVKSGDWGVQSSVDQETEA